MPLYQLKKSLWKTADEIEPYDNWWGLFLAIGLAILLLNK